MKSKNLYSKHSLIVNPPPYIPVPCVDKTRLDFITSIPGEYDDNTRTQGKLNPNHILTNHLIYNIFCKFTEEGAGKAIIKIENCT